MGCWVFKQGGSKLERFLPKNQHTRRKILNFENWCYGEVSKIGHHFRSALKIDSIKKVNNKECTPELVFFNVKDWEIFQGFLTLKVKYRHFLTPPHYTNSQNSKISIEYIDFYANLVPPAWKINNQYYHNGVIMDLVHRDLCAPLCPEFSNLIQKLCEVFHLK